VSRHATRDGERSGRAWGVVRAPTPDPGAPPPSPFLHVCKHKHQAPSANIASAARTPAARSSQLVPLLLEAIYPPSAVAVAIARGFGLKYCKLTGVDLSHSEWRQPVPCFV
jgi:hypothetical protein